MPQIILIENNKALFELLQLNLKAYTKSEVIPQKNANEAIQFLGLLPSVDMIVSTDTVLTEKTAELLLDYVRKNPNPPSLLIFGRPPSHEPNELVSVTDKTKWEDVVKAAGKLLGMGAISLSEEVKTDYVPIPVEYFYSIESTPCDVFIRIRKSPTEFQFVKRIHSGDSFDVEAIKRYEKGRLKNFYIPRDGEKYFTNFISNHLVSQLEQKGRGEDAKIKIIGESYNIAVKEIKRLGLTTATIQLTESIIVSMMETVERIPKMNNFLLKIVNSSSKYIYQHAHMTCAIASSCVRDSLARGEDKDIFQRIALASFFQNISLSDDEELARIHDQESLEKTPLEKEQEQQVLRHALESSEFVKDYENLPRGVDLLIRTHHGASDGVGFSNDLKKLPEETASL